MDAKSKHAKGLQDRQGRAIHALISAQGKKTWMPGIKPGMTKVDCGHPLWKVAGNRENKMPDWSLNRQLEKDTARPIRRNHPPARKIGRRSRRPGKTRGTRDIRAADKGRQTEIVERVGRRDQKSPPLRRRRLYQRERR